MLESIRSDVAALAAALSPGKQRRRITWKWPSRTRPVTCGTARGRKMSDGVLRAKANSSLEHTKGDLKCASSF
jgi:hypothetical protein